jgi:hypothetical protein
MPEDYLACHDSEVIPEENGLRSVVLMIAWLWRAIASSQPPEESIPFKCLVDVSSSDQSSESFLEQ